jgi:hypothetical protein
MAAAGGAAKSSFLLWILWFFTGPTYNFHLIYLGRGSDCVLRLLTGNWLGIGYLLDAASLNYWKKLGNRDTLTVETLKLQFTHIQRPKFSLWAHFQLLLASSLLSRLLTRGVVYFLHDFFIFPWLSDAFLAQNLANFRIYGLLLFAAAVILRSSLQAALFWLISNRKFEVRSELSYYSMILLAFSMNLISFGVSFTGFSVPPPHLHIYERLLYEINNNSWFNSAQLGAIVLQLLANWLILQRFLAWNITAFSAPAESPALLPSSAHSSLKSYFLQPPGQLHPRTTLKMTYFRAFLLYSAILCCIFLFALHTFQRVDSSTGPPQLLSCEFYDLRQQQQFSQLLTLIKQLIFYTATEGWEAAFERVGLDKVFNYSSRNKLELAMKSLELEPEIRLESLELSEIKAARNKLALQFHPDKIKQNQHRDMSAEDASAKFQQIQGAYQILEDFIISNGK